MVFDLIVVTFFVVLTEKSLPGLLECPGTHCMKMVDEMDDMH